MADTIFSKIIKREVPADIVFENENVLAFRDINPKAPVHILIIPKQEIARISEYNTAIHKDVLSCLFEAANIIAEQQKLDKGFRLVINCGPDGGQEVEHLHLHLLGGKKLGWNPA